MKCEIKKEILDRAIKKAIGNGWDTGVTSSYDLTWDGTLMCGFIIFDHDFARAFFGKGILKKGYREAMENKAFGGVLYYPYEEGAEISWKGKEYKYHLQQMVLEKEPLKYLEKFL